MLVNVIINQTTLIRIIVGEELERNYQLSVPPSAIVPPKLSHTCSKGDIWSKSERVTQDG